MPSGGGVGSVGSSSGGGVGGVGSSSGGGVVGFGSLPSKYRQCHIEFTRAQFSHRIFPGQAVKQFTSSRCFHFHNELLVTSIQSHVKAVACQGIKHKSPDSQ